MRVPYRIELPYAVFHIISNGVTIESAAPIAQWTVGKNTTDVLDYFRKKGKVKEFL